MCEGIMALTEMVPVLQKYKHPVTISKPHSDHSVRYPDFLKSALEDIEYFWENVNANEIDKGDAETYERTSKELINLYRLVANGSTPVMKVEQAVVTFLHAGM